MKKFLILGILNILFCQSIEKQEESNFYYSDEKTEDQIWDEISVDIQKKDFSKIESKLSKLFHKNNPKYLRIIGDYYFELKDYERSLEFYLLSYNKQKDLNLGLLISQNFVILGEIKQAISFLEEMQENFKDQNEILFQLGILYKQNNPKKSEKIFKDLLIKNLEEEKIYFHYLDSLLIQKKYEEVGTYLQSIKEKTFVKNFLHIWEVHFYLEKAKDALENNEIHSAIQSLSIAYGIDSENEELGLELVNLLCMIEEFSKAEKIISELKSLEWKFLSFGIYFFHKKDFEQSLEYLEQGALAYPNNSTYKKQLGNLFFYFGDTTKAKFFFQEGEKLNPNDSFFPLMLGKIALEENLLEVAGVEFQKAKNLKNKKAEFLYKFTNCLNHTQNKNLETCEKELLESEFEEKIIFLNLFGNFHFKNKNLSKAKYFFQMSLKHKLQFFVLLKLYEIFNQEGDLRNCLEYEKQISKFLKTHPEKKEIFLNLKNKLFFPKTKKNTFKLQLKNFSSQEIIQTYLKPFDLFKMQEVLNYLEEINQKEKALEILKFFIQENSDLKEFYGVYLVKLGEITKAYEIFKSLQSKENNYFIEYNLGFILLQTNPKKALEHFFTSLKFNSSYLFPYLGIAKAYYQLLDYQKADYYLELAKEKFGESETVLWNLGNLKLSLGEIQEAKKIFQRMKKKYDSSDAFYGLALVFEKQKKFHLAKKYLYEAIKREEKKIYLDKLSEIFNKHNPKDLSSLEILFLKKIRNSRELKKNLFNNKTFFIQESKIPFSLEELDDFHITNDLFFIIAKEKLYCVDKNNLAPKWMQSLPEKAKTSYLFAFGILVQTLSNQVFFYDRLSGDILWQKKFILSQIEKINGYFSIFLSVILENGIRKLYELDYNGNIINDLVLEETDEFYLDLNEKIYLLSRVNNYTVFHEISPNWKKQKIKKWKSLEIQFLTQGKMGIYIQTPQRIEFVSSQISNIIPFPSCQNWKLLEFEEKLYSICSEKIFKFEENWEEISDKNIQNQLKLFECSEIVCLKEFLSEKQSIKKKGLLFLEMNLNK